MAFGCSQAAVFKQAFQPALATACLVVVLSTQVFANVIFLFFNELCLGFIFGQPTGVAFLALVEVGGVVTTIDLKRWGHLPDHPGGLVEEVAIMRDDHHRAVPIAQVGFEPFHGIDIQVVAGFVQKEEVRIFQQNSRQAGTGALTARKLLERTLIVRLVKAQTAEGLLDAIAESVAALDVKLMLQFAITGQHLGRAGRVLHLELELAQFIAHLYQPFKGKQAVRPKRPFGLSNSFLGQVTNTQPARTEDIAFSRFIFARQNAQQGGFAHTIAAHDGNASIMRNRDTDPIKDIHWPKRTA